MAVLRRLAALLEREVPGLRPGEARRELEQYRTPPELALEMASLLHGCRLLVDLGAGTGMLSYAASLLHGTYVVGVDVDSRLLVAARGSSLYGRLLVDFVAAEVSRLPLRAGVHRLCVIQNPPFGVVRRGADRMFVEAAAGLGACTIVSLHLAPQRGTGFLRRLYGSLGYSYMEVGVAGFPLKQLHPRDVKRIHYTRVVIVVARKRGVDCG